VHILTEYLILVFIVSGRNRGPFERYNPAGRTWY